MPSQPFVKPDPVQVSHPRQKVFYPANKDHAQEIEKIYDMVYRNRGHIVNDRTEFDPKAGRFVQLLSWVEYEFLTEEQLDKEIDGSGGMEPVLMDAQDLDDLEGEDTEGDAP